MLPFMTENSAPAADPEIAAMGAIAAALSGLDEATRGRVLRWGADRFGLSAATSSPAPQAGRPLRSDNEDDEHDVYETAGGDVGFEHFAELHDAANPTSDAQRLLVAAYWTQVHESKPQFGSQELNKLLKDLGHGVGHISQRMESLIKQKPALVLQLRKAGKTAQARKTYKVTAAGIKAVEALVAGDG